MTSFVHHGPPVSRHLLLHNPTTTTLEMPLTTEITLPDGKSYTQPLGLYDRVPHVYGVSV
jgi:hypothetical protein